MADLSHERGGQERRRLVSRKEIQERFIGELRNFRKEFGPLQRNKGVTEQLLTLAQEVSDFLDNTSETAARQQKSGDGDDRESLVVQARALNQVTREQPRKSLLGLYKRMMGTQAIENIDSLIAEDNEIYKEKIEQRNNQQEITEETPSSELQEAQGDAADQLALELPRVFQETLNSSLPQVEILLKKFFPQDNEEQLQRRLLFFLRGVAQYVRLDRASANRKRGLGGIALPVGGIRDQLSSEHMRSEFLSRLLTYIVETSPLCDGVRAELANEGVVTQEVLEQLHAEYERDQDVLMSSENIRKANYRVWVAERAGERPRVAGSPADNADIEAIDRAHRTSNRVAGVIAYGPPGTGKTEKIIEANKRKGFETHVISMHRHSDFAQLMGEAPIFLEGLDQGAGKVQRVEAFQRMVNQSTDQLQKLFTSSPDLITRLLKLTPKTALRVEAQNKEVTGPLLEQFITELRGEVSNRLIDLYLGEEGSGDKDAAWVNGEIQRAIDENKMALLDEGDKAAPSAFDGISAILAKRPGENFTLGGREVHFPHWFRIDMTVNQTNLPEHIRDRFTALEIGYPETEDLLWKVGLFLADKQGEMGVEMNTEWQMTLFFTHVVPRIHELYAEERSSYEQRLVRDPQAQPDMYPFSMRGISTFCRKVMDGQPLDSVIEEEILRPGKLAAEGSDAHKRLLLLVKTLNGLTDQLVFANEASASPNGVAHMIESPLYNSIAASEADNQVATERVLQRVTVSDQQREQLTQNNVEATKPSETYRLASGAVITQERQGEGVRFRYSYTLGERTVSYFSHVYSTIKRPATILAADHFGERIVVQTENEAVVIEPITDAIAQDDALVENVPTQSLHVSKDGRYMVGIATQNEVPLAELVVKDAGFQGKLRFKAEGKNIPAKKVQMSEDGSVVVLESLDGRVYVCYPQRELARNQSDKTEIQVDLTRKELTEARGATDWGVNGDLLWSPSTEVGYIIS